MKIVRAYRFCDKGSGIAVWVAQRQDSKVALTPDFGKRFDESNIDSAAAVRSDSEQCWHDSPEAALAELLEAATRTRPHHTPQTAPQ